MASLNLILLPGLDGTGLLFQPFIPHLPCGLNPIVVSYPAAQPLGYEQLLPLVVGAIPRRKPFAILGESFSGPLAVMAAALAPERLKAIILCASFLRSPLPAGCGLVTTPFVRGLAFRLVPEFIRTTALLGGYATPELRHLLTEALATVPPDILAHRVRTLLQVDVRSQLCKCRVPVLYLRGLNDRIVSRRNLADVVAACRSTEVVKLSAPHLVLQAQPVAAAVAVSNFLSTAIASRV